MNRNFVHVHTLAIAEFRKDFPALAACLESMRDKAALGRAGDSVAASLRDGGAGGGAGLSAYPDGNNGDNGINLTTGGVL